MSRDRFLLITSFLHLSNNDDFIPRENPGQYCSAYRFVSVAISSKSSSLINILKESETVVVSGNGTLLPGTVEKGNGS
jgi:hypothetical protein